MESGAHKVEPTSTGAAAGFGIGKGIAALGGMGAIGAALASIVVMCIMTPRSAKEWAVGLISTVVSSIGGGAFVIVHFGLQSWASDFFGLVAMIALVFVCGLPGWALVRWTFNYIIKNQGATITEVADELRNIGH